MGYERRRGGGYPFDGGVFTAGGAEGAEIDYCSSGVVQPTGIGMAIGIGSSAEIDSEKIIDRISDPNPAVDSPGRVALPIGPGPGRGGDLLIRP